MRIRSLTLRAIPLAALIAGGCIAAPKWADPEPVSAAVAPGPADAALDRAADCFAKNDEAGAVPHLFAYLRRNPDALPARFQLAEVLYRTGDADRAGDEFARLLADAPEAGPFAARRSQCHARLASMAEARGDDFAEQLHRGAGLLRLVEKWDADPARRDDAAAEPVLSQALAALSAARELRPQDARANLYASQVLARLGQHAAAERLRRIARAGLPDAALGDAERDCILEDATSPR